MPDDRKQDGGASPHRNSALNRSLQATVEDTPDIDAVDQDERIVVIEDLTSSPVRARDTTDSSQRVVNRGNESKVRRQEREVNSGPEIVSYRHLRTAKGDERKSTAYDDARRKPRAHRIENPYGRALVLANRPRLPPATSDAIGRSIATSIQGPSIAPRYPHNKVYYPPALNIPQGRRRNLDRRVYVQEPIDRGPSRYVDEYRSSQPRPSFPARELREDDLGDDDWYEDDGFRRERRMRSPLVLRRRRRPRYDMMDDLDDSDDSDSSADRYINHKDVFSKQKLEEMIERRLEERETKRELERIRTEKLRLEMEQSALQKAKDEQVKAELARLHAAEERNKIEREVRERIEAEIKAEAQEREAEARRIQRFAEVAQAAMKKGVDDIVALAKENMLQELRMAKQVERERFEATIRAEIWATKQDQADSEDARQESYHKMANKGAHPRWPSPPKTPANTSVGSARSSTPSAASSHNRHGNSQSLASETENSQAQRKPDAPEPPGAGTGPTSVASAGTEDSDHSTMESVTSESSGLTSRRRHRARTYQRQTQEDRDRQSLRMIREELVDPIADALITGLAVAYGREPPPASFLYRQHQRHPFSNDRDHPEPRYDRSDWERRSADETDAPVENPSARHPCSRSRKPSRPRRPLSPVSEENSGSRVDEQQPGNLFLLHEQAPMLRDAHGPAVSSEYRLLEEAPAPATDEVAPEDVNEDDEDMFEDALEEQVTDNIDTEARPVHEAAMELINPILRYFIPDGKTSPDGG
ncbi:hypothetical protein QQS21_000231 [Conoideocrella luteorostrata]|uniref:Uncharacterized protein n=1 Tax=Conoideocrella luteorostrata TaxID=1105319 RepID=A0AAJ0G469_9HYPO|nr:hypothetical protein QQS21_000231 [Conoideocrella luteorostrata]